MDDLLDGAISVQSSIGSEARAEEALYPSASEPHGHFRILIVALNYAPELVGCAKYTSELAEALFALGHQVEVVCAPPYYPQWKISDGYSGKSWRREVLNGVTLHRTPLYVPSKPSGIKRLVHLASFGLSAFPAAIAVARRFRPEIVFAVAPTLAAAGSALIAARHVGARSWLHIQDFEVDAAFDLGLLRNKSMRQAALTGERGLFGRFDRVSTISPAMTELLGRKGLAQERIVELRNWVDVDAVPMFESSNTTYRQELAIGSNDIVALYSGNMAAKQGIETLADVAQRLAAMDAPITLILCGDGPARANLEQACGGLRNVRFLPLQPMERLPELLGTADIHLLPQRPEAADLVLPSKLTGMLASGRPVIAMAAPGSGLAIEVKGCGIIVEPTAMGMTDALVALAGDSERRRTLGLAGRARAETRWRKSAIIGRFEAEVLELTRARKP